jgi:type IV pilus assembly protein PilZ
VPGRIHERIPYSVRVKYRTASSFLVAYSVNLSRGGLFLETPDPAEVGSEVSLQFEVPNSGPIQVRGTVSWRRDKEDSAGPAGIGVEFAPVLDDLSLLIDQLVGDFTSGQLGINILIVSSDRQDLSTLKRMVKSIIGSAQVVSAPDPHVAAALLEDELELAIIDGDGDQDGAMSALAAATSASPPVPVILLSSDAELRDQAKAAGAIGVTGNPPPFQEFRRLLVRCLGRPHQVSTAGR